jgi:hypothetical protein
MGTIIRFIALKLIMKDDQKPQPVGQTEATEQDKPSTERKPKEIGGPKGPEPTRYGDWEKKGRCIDF